MIIQALNDKIKPEWIAGTIKVLQAFLNKEEEDWPEYPNMINVRNGMVDLTGIKPDVIDENLISTSY